MKTNDDRSDTSKVPDLLGGDQFIDLQLQDLHLLSDESLKTLPNSSGLSKLEIVVDTTCAHKTEHMKGVLCQSESEQPIADQLHLYPFEEPRPGTPVFTPAQAFVEAVDGLTEKLVNYFCA